MPTSLTDCKPMVVEYVIHRYTEDAPVDSEGWSVLVSGRAPAWRTSEVSWIEAVRWSPCCDDMAKHIVSRDVEFGTRREYTFRNKEAEVKLRTARGGKRAHTDKENDICLPYCPWCTQPVTTMDVTDGNAS